MGEAFCFKHNASWSSRSNIDRPDYSSMTSLRVASSLAVGLVGLGIQGCGKACNDVMKSFGPGGEDACKSSDKECNCGSYDTIADACKDSEDTKNRLPPSVQHCLKRHVAGRSQPPIALPR